MSELSPYFLEEEILERVDHLVESQEYIEGEINEGDLVYDEDYDIDEDGDIPHMVLERKVLSRDIITGSEFTVAEELCFAISSAGELVVKRWVTLDREDEEGEIEETFRINMCDGELRLETPFPNIISVVEHLENTLSTIEEGNEL